MVRTADSCFVTFFSSAFPGREGTDQKQGLTSPKMFGKFRNLGMNLGQDIDIYQYFNTFLTHLNTV